MRGTLLKRFRTRERSGVDQREILSLVTEVTPLYRRQGKDTGLSGQRKDLFFTVSRGLVSYCPRDPSSSVGLGLGVGFLEWERYRGRLSLLSPPCYHFSSLNPQPAYSRHKYCTLPSFFEDSSNSVS